MSGTSSLFNIGLFLIFLVLAQTAGQEEYLNIIDNTLTEITESFDHKFEGQYSDSGTNLDASFGRGIDYFITGAIFSIVGFMYLMAMIARFIPVDAITLVYLWVVLAVISVIPWSFLLGVVFLFKDWWKKRKAKRKIVIKK